MGVAISTGIANEGERTVLLLLNVSRMGCQQDIQMKVSVTEVQERSLS